MRLGVTKQEMKEWKGYHKLAYCWGLLPGGS